MSAAEEVVATLTDMWDTLVLIAGGPFPVLVVVLVLAAMLVVWAQDSRR